MRRNILVLLGLAALFVQSASGANWKVIPSPNGPLEVNQLHVVSALSENEVWAVGVGRLVRRRVFPEPGKSFAHVDRNVERSAMARRAQSKLGPISQ